MDTYETIDQPSESDTKLLTRIDERTKAIAKKIDSLCIWKDQAAADIHNLVQAELPKRVDQLENRQMYEAGAIALLVFMIGIVLYILDHYEIISKS